MIYFNSTVERVAVAVFLEWEINLVIDYIVTQSRHQLIRTNFSQSPSIDFSLWVMRIGFGWNGKILVSSSVIFQDSHELIETYCLMLIV